MVPSGEDEMRMLLIAGALLALSGCNTIEGIGQDLESVGETVADEAR